MVGTRHEDDIRFLVLFSHTPAPETSDQHSLVDPIRSLADVQVGMNNKSSTRTLMVRRLRKTTQTFVSKLENIELFEDFFDPNITTLFDCLEEINQGVEKAKTENAQAMIDSLLHSKLPPKLKRRPVNMARLENATYAFDEMTAHT